MYISTNKSRQDREIDAQVSLLPYPYMPLPALPPRKGPWVASIIHACHILNGLLETTSHMLNSGNYDRHCIEHHTSMIIEDVFPLIVALDDAAGDDKVPSNWLKSVAEMFVELVDALANILPEVVSEYVLVLNLNYDPAPDLSSRSSNYAIPEVVNIERTGRPGRPRKTVNLDLLQNAMDPQRRIPKTVLSNTLGIHRHTLRTRLQENNIESGYTNISDAELDEIVAKIRAEKPGTGRAYLDGYLRTKGLCIQRQRLEASVRRVDTVGNALRRRGRAKAKRKEYVVSRPNALWHLDGHHKLILWGIVIHGVVDGYSRKVTEHNLRINFIGTKLHV